MGAAPFPAGPRRILAPGAGWPLSLPPAPLLSRAPAAQSSSHRRLLGARSPRSGPPPLFHAVRAAPARHCPVPPAAFRPESPAVHWLCARPLAPLDSACALGGCSRDVPLHVPPFASCVLRPPAAHSCPGRPSPPCGAPAWAGLGGAGLQGAGPRRGLGHALQALGIGPGRLVPTGGLLTQQPEPRGLPLIGTTSPSGLGRRGRSWSREAGDRESLPDERVAAWKRGGLALWSRGAPPGTCIVGADICCLHIPCPLFLTWPAPLWHCANQKKTRTILGWGMGVGIKPMLGSFPCWGGKREAAQLYLLGRPTPSYSLLASPAPGEE